MRTPFHIKLLTWLGIAAISVQLNVVPLDFMLFRLNQDQIARTLCEHKMPHCNGNCYLMKQLAKSANAENEKRTERFAFQLSGQYLRSDGQDVVCFPSLKRNVPNPNVSSTLPGFHTTILQPPRFA